MGIGVSIEAVWGTGPFDCAFGILGTSRLCRAGGDRGNFGFRGVGSGEVHLERLGCLGRPSVALRRGSGRTDWGLGGYGMTMKRTGGWGVGLTGSPCWFDGLTMNGVGLTMNGRFLRCWDFWGLSGTFLELGGVRRDRGIDARAGGRRGGACDRAPFCGGGSSPGSQRRR